MNRIVVNSLRLALALVISVGATSCSSRVTSQSDARPFPPQPRALQAPPPGAKADAIVLQVAAKPRDTNGNSFPDLVEVLVNLFSDDASIPIYEEGTFIFRVYSDGRADDPQALPVREWRIPSAKVTRNNRIRTLYGPTYKFNLSFLDDGGDRFPIMVVDLTCAFEPDDGRGVIHRRDVHKMQIGAGAQ